MARLASERWDWESTLQAAGVGRDGRFNVATLPFPSPRALLWHREDGTGAVLGGEDVRRLAARIAGALETAGFTPGDRVLGLMGRRPEAFAAPIAVWWLGGVYVPLFTGFGSESIRVRAEDSGARFAVTDLANRARLGEIEDRVRLTTLVVDGAVAGDLGHASDHAPTATAPADTHAEAPATIMYTSGTTGRPKGCVIPHRGVLSLAPYVEHCLALRRDDLLFSMADTGWSFGLLTTGLAPLAAGGSRLLFEPGFDAAAIWDAVERWRATHLVGAPTAFRQLRSVPADRIRVAAASVASATSAGEPLPADLGAWYAERLGLGIHDSYGLSELGMIVAVQRGSAAGRPVGGSMGRPLPGFDVQVVRDDGSPADVDEPGVLAVRDSGNLLACDYWGRSDEWASRCRDGWWVTEDVVRRDADGLLWYVGRGDDIIVTAGYNVAPVEVEGVLAHHPLVDEAGCVGLPDERKGVAVVAFVVPAAGTPPDALEGLHGELRRFVGEQVGWHAAPRRTVVVDALPRTESGKLIRSRLAGLETGGAGA